MYEDEEPEIDDWDADFEEDEEDEEDNGWIIDPPEHYEEETINGFKRHDRIIVTDRRLKTFGRVGCIYQMGSQGAYICLDGKEGSYGTWSGHFQNGKFDHENKGIQSFEF